MKQCEKEDTHFDFASFLVGVTLSFFGTAIILRLCSESPADVRKEAVEHHHARWVSDASGHTHFEWIEPWDAK